MGENGYKEFNLMFSVACYECVGGVPHHQLSEYSDHHHPALTPGYYAPAPVLSRGNAHLTCPACVSQCAACSMMMMSPQTQYHPRPRTLALPHHDHDQQHHQLHHHDHDQHHPPVHMHPDPDSLRYNLGHQHTTGVILCFICVFSLLIFLFIFV